MYMHVLYMYVYACIIVYVCVCMHVYVCMCMYVYVCVRPDPDKSLGPQPVGVQCPFTSSQGEFPGYTDWLWYPGLSPVLVSTSSLLLPYLGVFPFITLLHLPLDFIGVSSL